MNNILLSYRRDLKLMLAKMKKVQGYHYDYEFRFLDETEGVATHFSARDTLPCIYVYVGDPVFADDSARVGSGQFTLDINFYTLAETNKCGRVKVLSDLMKALNNNYYYWLGAYGGCKVGLVSSSSEYINYEDLDGFGVEIKFKITLDCPRYSLDTQLRYVDTYVVEASDYNVNYNGTEIILDIGFTTYNNITPNVYEIHKDGTILSTDVWKQQGDMIFMNSGNIGDKFEVYYEYIDYEIVERFVDIVEGDITILDANGNSVADEHTPIAKIVIPVGNVPTVDLYGILEEKPYYLYIGTYTVDKSTITIDNTTSDYYARIGYGDKIKIIYRREV